MTVFPMHKRNTARHSVVIIMNMVCSGGFADNGYNIRMIHRLIVQRKTGIKWQKRRQGVQLFNEQQSVLRLHLHARSAIDIAMPAVCVASGNHQIKINCQMKPPIILSCFFPDLLSMATSSVCFVCSNKLNFYIANSRTRSINPHNSHQLFV